jgi:uncharacterized membrane protein SpoIIM required for sporulation/ABC-type transport system involved in multi-copper enzyme maturation permease subunit
MKEKWGPVFLVAKRELRDQLRDWRILMPIIILTMFFPLLMNVAVRYAVNFVTRYGADLIAERMVPFFIMIVGFFPITVGLVVALESFVGEKERGTIEPLLSSPLDDWQLYTGKFLAGLTLPLAAAYLDIFIYLLTLVWQRFQMPPTWMLAYVLLLTFVEAVTLVSAAIFVSTQSATVRSANLLASFIVIPMALLLQAESTVLFFGQHLTFWLTILGLLLLSLFLIRLGMAHFQREVLLNRRDNAFSPAYIWKQFRDGFRAGQPSLRAWYADLFRFVREKLSVPLGIAVALGLVAAVATFFWTDYRLAQLVSDGASMPEWERVAETFPALPVRGLTAGWIFWHNVRAVIVMVAFGFVSVSLAGMLFYLANFSVIGAVLAMVKYAGLPLGDVVVRGVLPHGIVEIPALVLTGAIVFYSGARLMEPRVDVPLGTVLLEIFVDMSRLIAGLILPLLLVAALIEAYITPILLQGVI